MEQKVVGGEFAVLQSFVEMAGGVVAVVASTNVGQRALNVE